MPAACRSSSRRRQQPHRRELRHAGDRHGRIGGQLARATAAHSTVTFNDSSSCRFRRIRATFRRVLGGSPMMRWPQHTSRSSRDEQDRRDACCAPSMTATRSVSASCMSASCRWPPTVRPSKARTSSCPPTARQLSPDAQDHFAVRFHLHPSIKATRLTDGHGAVLMMPNKEVWTFDTQRDIVAARGKRLSRRHGRAAPHRADRHPWPRASGRRVLLDFQSGTAAMCPPGGTRRSRRSRGCRRDGWASRHGDRIDERHDRPSAPHRPAPFISVSDKTGADRIRPRACRPRHRTRLDRRHRARRCASAGLEGARRRAI